MNPHLQNLAEYVASFHLAEAPPHVGEATKLVALDTFGAILAGSQLPEFRALTEYAVREGGGGACALLGHRSRTSASYAALVNGGAGTAYEMDEGHRLARGHPAIHVLPAALAEAEQRDCSGADLLAALLVGYEVAARVGVAGTLRPGMHCHGTWGVVGGAAAVARLRGFRPNQVAGALNLAAGLTLSPSYQSAFEGATVRNMFSGFGGFASVVAVQLYECGFTGEVDGLGTTFGRLNGGEFRQAELDEELGQRFEITRNYFKRHACCRFNHSALDALADAVADHRPAPDAIESVEVVTYAPASDLVNPEPASLLGAKFSIPFAVGAALVKGHSGHTAFTNESIRDPEILALAHRVQVRENADFTAQTPAERPARVTIRLRGGEQIERTVRNARGDFEDPVPPAELRAKFRELATIALGDVGAAALERAVDELDTRTDARELARLGQPT